MPFARNSLDGVGTYYEDDGGDGPVVVVYGGISLSIAQSRSWPLVQALKLESRARLVFPDHRGHGRSDKPTNPSDYSAVARSADFSAVLDALEIERANFLGYSWGARLGFSVGEHQPARVMSLTLGGHHPYAARPDVPVSKTILDGLAIACREGMAKGVEHIETQLGGALPEDFRQAMLANEPEAVYAALMAVLDEGAVSSDLGGWNLPCLIYAGTEDVDFYEDAKHAAREIPSARFISLSGLDHGTAAAAVEQVLPSVLEILEASS